MTCLSCASAQIQDPKNLKRDKALKGMAAEGYIVCNLSPYRATFHRFDHVCNKYSQAADEVIRARLEWRQVSPALPEQGRYITVARCTPPCAQAHDLRGFS